MSCASIYGSVLPAHGAYPATFGVSGPYVAVLHRRERAPVLAVPRCLTVAAFLQNMLL